MHLVAEDVHREYGDTVALDGVSLSVEAGEVFALIGPNGAGKTTLVRALTGTTDVEGHVELLGTAPRDADPQRVGLLPQSFDPPERLTARELVTYYAGLYDGARPVDAVLADVGMADDADQWYETLSGGQQRRVCVAIALVNDPDVLFLDEPTTGIDPAGRRDLWALLDGLAEGGTTVFLTTHSMAEAERLADRVGLLNDGRLVAMGTPAALVTEHGGEPRLALELADGSDGDDVVTALETTDVLDGRVEATARACVVHGVGPREVGAVLDALDGAGVTYTGLRWHQPDLESVYLTLTGESVTETGEAVEREGVMA